VLCAVDLGRMAPGTIQTALAAAGTIVASSQVEFLHVTRRVPSTLPRHGWWLADPAYRRSEQLALACQLQALIPSGDASRKAARVVAGRPASEIVSAGVTRGAALIVIGMTRRGPLGRRLRRSTAVTVMRESPCPVLVVPPGLAAAAARLRAAA
jgi:nucleotide-binding universal stress UspA family protein